MDMNTTSTVYLYVASVGQLNMYSHELNRLIVLSPLVLAAPTITSLYVYCPNQLENRSDAIDNIVQVI